MPEKYTLMNKDVPVLEFEIFMDVYHEPEFTEIRRYDAVLPIGFESIAQWVKNRQAPKHREHIEKLMRQCGCYELDGYIKVTMCLGLNDTFWTKPFGSNIQWRDVSLYQNEFNEVISRLAFEGGLFGEQFTSTSPEFATDGAYAKCWIRENADIFLLKAGTEGFSNAGLEPYSECYASEVASKICKTSVIYTIGQHHNKVVSKCKLFCDEQTGYVPAAKLLPKGFGIRDMMKLYAAYDSEEDFRRMIVLDALVLNTDRHAGNHGLLVDNDTMTPLGMSPVFDLNQALLPYALREDFEHLEEYLQTKGPRIGTDFNEIAYQMLTPSIRADLINLKGFEFTRGKIDLPEKRMKILEELINSQIDKILKGTRLYIYQNAPETVYKGNDGNEK